MTWLDGLRLAAGVSMVGLHASSDALGRPWIDYPEAERLAPLLFRAVIYTARTELFLIISLFLLMMSLDRRPRSYLGTITEQARRLLLPFAFWVLVFAFWRLIKASTFGYQEAILAQLGAPSAWLGYLILGDVQYHMHFLPTLFGLVLFFPLYRFAVDRPWLGLIVIACLIFKREADVWIWSEMKDVPGSDYILRGLKILTYTGYGFVAAAFWGLLRRRAVAAHWSWPVLLLAGGLFAVKLVHVGRVIAHGDWQFNWTPGYWADFLMPVVLFALAMTLRHRAWPEWISRAAPYSFGIYLCHPVILDLAEIAMSGASPTITPAGIVAAKIAITLPSAVALSLALKQSRWLGWTVGLGGLPRLPGPGRARSEA